LPHACAAPYGERVGRAFHQGIRSGKAVIDGLHDRVENQTTQLIPGAGKLF
jgi:hypothetical protein